jgi:hypothetical protein
MYHWYSSSVNSSRNLSMYSDIFDVLGFWSRGYTRSLLQRAARLLKSRYFSASSKARVTNPYLSEFSFLFSSTLTYEKNSLSVLRTSGRNCWNRSASAAISRSVPGTSVATELQDNINSGSNHPSLSTQFGRAFEVSSSVRGQKQKEQKQDREADSWVREFCAHQVSPRDLECKSW